MKTFDPPSQLNSLHLEPYWRVVPSYDFEPILRRSHSSHIYNSLHLIMFGSWEYDRPNPHRWKPKFWSQMAYKVRLDWVQEVNSNKEINRLAINEQGNLAVGVGGCWLRRPRIYMIRFSEEWEEPKPDPHHIHRTQPHTFGPTTTIGTCPQGTMKRKSLLPTFIQILTNTMPTPLVCSRKQVN